MEALRMAGNLQLEQAIHMARTIASRKLWRYLIILALFTVAGTAVVIKVTSVPAFCGSCHEMKPEYMTWQVSAHNKVACTACHVEPGVVSTLQHKLSSLKQVFDHVTKRYYLPIELNDPVGNRICERCHTSARNITPSGDIKIPHDKHLAAGVTCVGCHAGVAHGMIAERQATIDGDFDRWTPTVGRENMAGSFKVIKMDRCIACHKDNQGPQTCEACHKVIVRPPSHQQAAWVNGGEHGLKAFQDVQACNKCHSNSLSFKTQHSSDQVSSYARNNTYCVDCHRKKPAGHSADWNMRHGESAKQDQRGCLVCHEQAAAKKSDQVADTVCITCHKPHHGWPSIHPIPLAKGSPPNNTCYTCHPQEQCTSCHR